MTRSEARKILTENLPATSSFCLQIDDWQHAKTEYSDSRNSVNYTVSVLPGLDGGKCDQWTGSSIEEAVGKFLAAVKPTVKPTEEQLDAEFAADEAIAKQRNETAIVAKPAAF